MKKIGLFGALAIFLLMCACSTNDKTTDLSTEANLIEEPESKKEVKPEHLTKQTFIEKVFDYENNPDVWVFKGDKPCIIDFYATWCGPCKKIAPILDELSKEYEGKVNIYKIDIDKEKELANAFGISSVPALLFCPKENQPQMVNGGIPKETFVQIINDVLLPTAKKEKI